MCKTEMEKSSRYLIFLGLVSMISGEVATVAHQSYSFHYPVLNDLIARATSQISPVSYVSKNGLVHLRMRPVLSFLPTVKNAGYSVWGHMQKVGHNFHKAMLSGFPLQNNYQYGTSGVGGVASSSAYDNHVGSTNNISPIRSAWTRIKCFPFGSKCHQQSYKSNNNYNNNYNSNYNNNNNNNYNSNYNNNNNVNYDNNYNSNYDNFNNYNNNYHYN